MLLTDIVADLASDELKSLWSSRTERGTFRSVPGFEIIDTTLGERNLGCQVTDEQSSSSLIFKRTRCLRGTIYDTSPFQFRETVRQHILQ